MKSTSKTNDGFEIIPFHTFLPQPDEEAQDERKRERQRESQEEREGEREIDRERWRCATPAKTFSISPTISCVITDVV